MLLLGECRAAAHVTAHYNKEFNIFLIKKIK
jgi:hypothetical protein